MMREISSGAAAAPPYITRRTRFDVEGREVRLVHREPVDGGDGGRHVDSLIDNGAKELVHVK